MMRANDQLLNKLNIKIIIIFNINTGQKGCKHQLLVLN